MVADLVLRTAFMSRDEEVARRRDYEEGGALPSSFFDGSDAPVDPNSGAVHEHLFDPYRLAGLDDGLRVQRPGHRALGAGRAAAPSSDLLTDSSAVRRARNHPVGAVLHDRCAASVRIRPGGSSQAKIGSLWPGAPRYG